MCKLVNYSSTDVPTVCETVAIQFPFTVHPFVLPALCPKLMQSALSTILLIHHNATNQCSLCAPPPPKERHYHYTIPQLPSALLSSHHIRVNRSSRHIVTT